MRSATRQIDPSLPSRAPALLAGALLITLSLALGAQDAAATETGFAKVKRVCAPARPGTATCAALALVPVPASEAATPGVRRLAVQARPAGGAPSGPAGGKSPAQYAEAYEYEPTKGGTGQTVAIVDAYDDPAVEEDLAKFDSHYGLGECTTSNGCFEKVGQTGTGTLPVKDTSGWSVEISLDVEAVRSVCRNCKILLVEAKNESFVNLAAAVDTAVSLGATEVSNSYAGPEEGFDESERKAYEHPGVIIAAATGDDGYYDWDYYNEGATSSEVPAEPGAPASLPAVVGVGGTSLYLGAGGKRSSETVWNENGPGDDVGLAEGRGREHRAAAAARSSRRRNGSSTPPASPPAAAGPNASVRTLPPMATRRRALTSMTPTNAARPAKNSESARAAAG